MFKTKEVKEFDRIMGGFGDRKSLRNSRKTMEALKEVYTCNPVVFSKDEYVNLERYLKDHELNFRTCKNQDLLLLEDNGSTYQLKKNSLNTYIININTKQIVHLGYEAEEY